MGSAVIDAGGIEGGDTLSFYTEITEERDDTYFGETWAEDSCDELGFIRWHSDGHTTFIDMIETSGRTPLLGLRLLKTLQDHNKQLIDPGMMNEVGRRLWGLFRSRYSR